MIRNAAVLLRGYMAWMRALPQATGLIFAARTRAGRSLKMILFGIGVVLPLGSLLWMLLFWHGHTLAEKSRAIA